MIDEVAKTNAPFREILVGSSPDSPAIASTPSPSSPCSGAKVSERRAFIESSVEEIVVPGDTLMRYTVPMPEDNLYLDGPPKGGPERLGSAYRQTLVGRLGFEPRTLGLKVRCSDRTELPAHKRGTSILRTLSTAHKADAARCRSPSGRDRTADDVTRCPSP